MVVMVVKKTVKRKQKNLVFHKVKDAELIRAIESDKSVAFSVLVRQLLREHYSLIDKNSEN